MVGSKISALFLAVTLLSVSAQLLPGGRPNRPLISGQGQQSFQLPPQFAQMLQGQGSSQLPPQFAQMLQGQGSSQMPQGIAQFAQLAAQRPQWQQLLTQFPQLQQFSQGPQGMAQFAQLAAQRPQWQQLMAQFQGRPGAFQQFQNFLPELSEISQQGRPSQPLRPNIGQGQQTATFPARPQTQVPQPTPPINSETADPEDIFVRD